MLYENSYMETYRTTHATLDQPCQVRIETGIITIEYLQDNEPASYRGQEQGPGHFLLTGHESGGKATLHMFEGSNILEGGWVEGGAKGMWRIRLG
ncbi:hypothetical protein [uncultured Pseudomonas sp.]|uniref:hypothetical protein n=1 Tax=uncultured Pseudomonas sp. TaxID=114707 RepID=UPI0030DB4A81|tara:strand:- start:1958 stop:2242 length:285 start_codon:yes stop_codon:yes gene_type:complete